MQRRRSRGSLSNGLQVKVWILLANIISLNTTVVSFLFMVLKTYMSLLYRLQDISTSLFFDEFVSFLEIVCSFDGDIMLGGDASIHLDIAHYCNTKKFLDICYTSNLLQLIDSITHNKGHQLNFLITNNKKIIKNVYLNSDHYLIQFKYSNQIKTSPQYKTVHT